jgi:hypothetical protein
LAARAISAVPVGSPKKRRQALNLATVHGVVFDIFVWGTPAPKQIQN